MAATKRTSSNRLAVISDACSYVLKARMDFAGAGDGTALQNRCWSQCRFGSKVAFNHPIHGVRPVGVRRAKNLIEDVKVNSEFLHIVFDGSEAEVDEVDGFTVDEQVVAGQVAVGHGLPVKAANACADALQRVPNGAFLRFWCVENVDEGCAFKVLNDELASFVIQIPYSRHGQARFPGANQEASFAHHAPNAQAVVKVGVTPRTGAALFPDGGLPEPHALPNLSLCPEVKAFGGREDHAVTQAPAFFKLQPHPFLEKGLVRGQVEAHEHHPPHVHG